MLTGSLEPVELVWIHPWNKYVLSHVSPSRRLQWRNKMAGIFSCFPYSYRRTAFSQSKIAFSICHFNIRNSHRATNMTFKTTSSIFKFFCTSASQFMLYGCRMLLLLLFLPFWNCFIAPRWLWAHIRLELMV